MVLRRPCSLISDANTTAAAGHCVIPTVRVDGAAAAKGIILAGGLTLTVFTFSSTRFSNHKFSLHTCSSPFFSHTL